jgi:hypothetical protein
MYLIFILYGFSFIIRTKDLNSSVTLVTNTLGTYVSYHIFLRDNLNDIIRNFSESRKNFEISNSKEAKIILFLLSLCTWRLSHRHTELLLNPKHGNKERVMFSTTI